MQPENETPQRLYVEPAHELVLASSGKRFANYLIDLVFFYLIIIFWVAIAAIVSPSSVEGLADSEDAFGTLADRFLSLVAYAVIMSLIEAIFRGKSIGKLITGTKAVNEDGSAISFSTAFARGFSRAVPFEPFSALGGTSYPWHDKWTKTYVINENETRLHNEQLRAINHQQMLQTNIG
jgi:uncharacterized RDD family membrane protein YckC